MIEMFPMLFTDHILYKGEVFLVSKKANQIIVLSEKYIPQSCRCTTSKQ